MRVYKVDDWICRKSTRISDFFPAIELNRSLGY